MGRVAREDTEFVLRRGGQTQCEQTVRDRRAQRRLPGAIHVDVNPLVIAAAFGKLIDQRLVDQHAARHTEIATDVVEQGIDAIVMEMRHQVSL